MDYCQCEAIEEQFNKKKAQKKRRAYRQDGLKRESQMLVADLVAQGIDGCSLLDVGGGMGALAIELIKRGVTRATINEASTAYLEAAAAETGRHGLADQISLVHGNIAAMDLEIPPADLVTLDKVICCYDDMPGLVQASLARSRKLYGLVYPRDNWLMKAVIGFDNLLSRLQGSDFRVFVYPTREVDGLIQANGFQMLSHRISTGWQIVVYGRVGAKLPA
ncbi:MAG: class I SAM-dependent methyltransferase [Chloroflexota bacterium]|nr:MAG: class I SAM-dependent methyltransferase [Chloroflexota bacterium]